MSMTLRPTVTTWFTASCAAVLLMSQVCHGQPVTTIITHGFDPDVGEPKLAPWIDAMAVAIIDRSPTGQGSIWTYQPSTGSWEGGGAIAPGLPIVLIFNWVAESDGGLIPGVNWGYTQGAADALYAALRHPTGPLASVLSFDLIKGRIVHFIGHSRGTCVNSETIRRLALANLPVDQVTTLDPHPVDGFSGGDLLNWGDPMPRKWKLLNGSDTLWGDNYWRADPFNLLDFNGIALSGVLNRDLDEGDLDGCISGPSCPLNGPCDFPLNQNGYPNNEHSDVHLWYHGTIDASDDSNDGDACISSSMRELWYAPMGCDLRDCEDGFFYSATVAGNRPTEEQGSGDDPGTLPILYNGDFDVDGHASYAGWSYHGGNPDAELVVDNLTNSVAAELRLAIEVGGIVDDEDELIHNRFWLPADSQSLTFNYRVVASPNDGDILIVYLCDPDVCYLPIATFAPSAGDVGDGWVEHVAEIPAKLPRERAYLLGFNYSTDSISTDDAVVRIDDVEITSLTQDNIHYVPSEYPTIQAAINAAVDDDQIVVASGTYAETIDLLGKAVTLRSSAGAGSTVIDGNDAGTVVRCVSGESQNTVIDGFTITGGQGNSANDSGGGMFNSNSHPTITNCIVIANQAGDDGSGMLNLNSSPTVSGCQFIDNIGPADGGAMYNKNNSNPTIVGCVFMGNQSVGAGFTHAGGAMVNHSGSSPTITNCEFINNFATRLCLTDRAVAGNAGSWQV